MATYEIINTTTVGSGGLSSISFSAIPQTYTDLLLKFSGRNSRSNDNLQEFNIYFNNNTAGVYTVKYVRGSGSTAISNNYPSDTSFNQLGQPAGTATSDTFSNYDIYISNYTNSVRKNVWIEGVTENNAVAAYAYFQAGIFDNTTPISTITVTAPSYLITQYSSFYLYGIKNS